jgi:hypothetical protein
VTLAPAIGPSEAAQDARLGLFVTIIQTSPRKRYWLKDAKEEMAIATCELMALRFAA